MVAQVRIDEAEMANADDWFTLVLPDKRKWLFQVPTNRDLKRWIYAIEFWRSQLLA